MLAAQNPLLSQLGKCLNLIGSEFRTATARKQVFLGNDAQTGWKGTFRRRARHTLLAHNLANRQHYSEADCVPTVSRNSNEQNAALVLFPSTSAATSWYRASSILPPNSEAQPN